MAASTTTPDDSPPLSEGEPARPGPSKRRGAVGVPEVTWGPADAGWGLLAGLILAILIAPALVLPFDPDLDSTGALLAAQALVGATLLAVALGMASGWKRRRLSEAPGRLGLRGFRPSALGWTLLTLFSYYLVAGLFAEFVLQPDQDDIADQLGFGHESVAVVAVVVILIAVVAPITEEMFFRGFVFAGLRSKMSLFPAALLSGLAFGSVHIPTGPLTVIPLAALGFALAWLYDRTGSLWPPIAAHAVNNGLALALFA